MNKNITQSLNDFEQKYGINRDLIVKYITSVELNDESGKEMYNLIFSSLCPKELYSDMKSDLSEIMKSHFNI